MQHITVSGYYGFGNAGDELILCAILNKVFSHFKNVSVTILSANPHYLYGKINRVNTIFNISLGSEIYPVKFIDRYSFPQIVEVLKRTDLFISGGGGLIQDTTSWYTPYYYLGLINLALALNRPVLVYAQGINQLKNFITRKYCVELFQRTKYVTLRDKFSLELLNSWGYHSHHLPSVTVDPVWTLKPQLNVTDIDYSIGTFPRKIGLILRYVRYLNIREYINFWVKVTDELLSIWPETEIRFIPFHSSYDTQLIRPIETPIPSRWRVTRWRNLDELIGLIKGTDLVFSTRYHGIICAAMLTRVFIPIAHNPKCRNLYVDLGLNEFLYTGTLTVENVIEHTLWIWQQRREFINGVQDKINRYTEKMNFSDPLNLL